MTQPWPDTTTTAYVLAALGQDATAFMLDWDVQNTTPTCRDYQFTSEDGDHIEPARSAHHEMEMARHETTFYDTLHEKAIKAAASSPDSVSVEIEFIKTTDGINPICKVHTFTGAQVYEL